MVLIGPAWTKCPDALATINKSNEQFFFQPVHQEKRNSSSTINEKTKQNKTKQNMLGQFNGSY